MTDTMETTSRTGAYVRGIRWGLAALVGSAAIAWYGAYGDPHPKADQESAVPAIIGVMAVVIVVLYGAVVAPGLRGVAAHSGRWAGIGLALGILGLLAVPVSAWSGLPLTLGLAATALGAATRTAAARAGAKRALPGWAMGIGLAATVLSVVMVVVGNTVLSS